jgi:hypothetical protein
MGLPRKKASTETSLTLALPISRERAFELTEMYPIATKYRRFVVRRKGGTTCGPYYKAFFVRHGRAYNVHLGGQDRKDELEAAHTLVRAELEAEAAALPAAVAEMIRRHARLFGSDALLLENLKRKAPARVISAAGARLVNDPTSEVGTATSAR